MTIGRNELCTCGSGKKYKNCCYLIKAEGKSSIPALHLILGAVVASTGAVLFYTHGIGVGGPVLLAGIAAPVFLSSILDPPKPKANADDSAALKFGK